jgi:hypothetical protein
MEEKKKKKKKKCEKKANEKCFAFASLTCIIRFFRFSLFKHISHAASVMFATVFVVSDSREEQKIIPMKEETAHQMTTKDFFSKATSTLNSHTHSKIPIVRSVSSIETA